MVNLYWFPPQQIFNFHRPQLPDRDPTVQELVDAWEHFAGHIDLGAEPLYLADHGTRRRGHGHDDFVDLQAAYQGREVLVPTEHRQP